MIEELKIEEEIRIQHLLFTHLVSDQFFENTRNVLTEFWCLNFSEVY